MPVSIGLDIGGTSISTVICDEKGKVLFSSMRESDYYGSRYLDNIEEIIEIALKESNEEVKGIGIGIPGTVDHIAGRVIVCPAFQWKDVLLKDHIERRFGIETFIDNDVNAWTMAEKYVGSARGIDNFALLTIGTGIGCGLCIGGKIYRGYSNESGEIGYLPLSLDAYMSEIHETDFGYFESKASASAVSRIYQNITGRQASCKDVFQLAKAGDAEAKKVVKDTYNYLGLGISAIICVLNPQIVLIGGGMAEEGQEFFDKLQEHIQRLIPLKVKLGHTKTGIFGGAIGSALGVYYR